MEDPTQGVSWAVLSNFAHPKTHFGLMWAKTMIWPYLGLRGSSRNSEGTCPKYNPPPPPPPTHTHLVVSTPQNGLNAPLDPRFAPTAVLVAPFWAVGLIVGQTRDLAVCWAPFSSYILNWWFQWPK